MAHPEYQHTAPVARGQVASIGVVQNYGTAKGGAGASAIGVANNASIGGAVSNGGQTFQQAPVSPSAVVPNPLEGGSHNKVSTSSVNPESIQDDSAIAAEHTKSHAQTSDAPSSSVSNGHHTDMPRAQTQVELPSSREGVRAQSATLTADVTIDMKGVETSRTFGAVDDLERIANDEGVVKAPGRGSTAATRQNGADGPPRGKGDPTPQERNTELDGLENNDIVGNNPSE